jgi:arsenite methyltransferase
VVAQVDYGLDAPGVVRRLQIASILTGLVGLLLYWLLANRWPITAWVSLVDCSFWAIVNAVFARLMIRSSRSGKRRFIQRLVDQFQLNGHETVLDLGCGRGAVLIALAKRLTGGGAIGVDIWQTKDQAGNGATAARYNATIEGVSDRVELVTADIRQLPFQENSFDLITANLVIHNLPNRQAREAALAECVRLLKPGGQLVIVDFQRTRHYAEHLKALGLTVTRSRRRWALFPPVRVVEACFQPSMAE